jgi:hypothetical protein
LSLRTDHRAVKGRVASRRGGFQTRPDPFRPGSCALGSRSRSPAAQRILRIPIRPRHPGPVTMALVPGWEELRRTAGSGRPQAGQTRRTVANGNRARSAMRGRGFEPPSPYGHYHLKVARLPIPPPAQSVLALIIDRRPGIVNRDSQIPEDVRCLAGCPREGSGAARRSAGRYPCTAEPPLAPSL